VSLVVDDLRVYYRSLAGDVKAVDGIDLELADGEIMGLAGESGCGKSTLGKALIKLDSRMRWVSGTVTLDGTLLPIWDDAVMDRHRLTDVSLVPQYAMSALNPTRKVGPMIHDLLRARGIDFSKVRPELERRLRLVGLDTGVLDMFPIEMSGGMKQRVVLVISTLLDPSLLIADEITSALDVSTQKAVAEMLVEFRDREFIKSAIVITHDLSILAQVADSIVVMYAGKLAEKADVRTVVDAPRHPYTRMLIASMPEVGVRFAEHRLAGIEGRPPSLIDPPAGCRFRDRCPLAGPRCAAEPAYRTCGARHLVACWEEEAAA
jgi:peptide/nickel transport system ATP-binding protein